MASSRLLWCLCILALSVGSNARFLHRASHPEQHHKEQHDEAAVTSLVKQAAASSTYKNTEVCIW
jgi:hypothetical protein